MNCGHDHTVLIVEDDQDIRESLAEILATEGYTVRTAGNGQDALEMLKLQRPCLVLLDLMMPVMNGWQVAAEIRDNPKLPTIPFCILSAISDQAPAGTVCILRKPLDLEKLLAVVHRYCSDQGLMDHR